MGEAAGATKEIGDFKGSNEAKDPDKIMEEVDRREREAEERHERACRDGQKEEEKEQEQRERRRKEQEDIEKRREADEKEKQVLVDREQRKWQIEQIMRVCNQKAEEEECTIKDIRARWALGTGDSTSMGEEGR
ncbi:complexin-2-like [Ambystoma mexicanum]|uniref:complexin-2-like n=1 Tax=Ambystoma mexicanum TaxID=8296 RepID=UPI0037E72AD7